MIRQAGPADQTAVETVVREAYSVYIDRIGKPPGPMLDDYAALIAAGTVSILKQPDETIAAIVVLLPKPDHLLLDNIAVRRDRRSNSGYDRVFMTKRLAETRYNFP